MKNEREQMGLFIYKKHINNNSSDNYVCIRHLDGSKHYNGRDDVGMKDEELKKL